MTVVVTSDVSARVRGFLSSCMLELAPGVYTAPRMVASVRDRVCEVLSGWWGDEPRGSMVMTWVDREAVGGQAVWNLGTPKKTLVDAGDELYLVRCRDL